MDFVKMDDGAGGARAIRNIGNALNSHSQHIVCEHLPIYLVAVILCV